MSKLGEDTDQYGIRRLAGAMIGLTIKDMDRRRARKDRPNRSREQHVTATLWMASAEATIWFDIVGINQAVALQKLDWAPRAQRVLDTQPLSPDERKLLRKGIDVLGPRPG